MSFPCPHCHKIHYNQGNLDLHITMIHKYTCQTCFTVFTTHQDLLVHRQEQDHDWLQCGKCGVIRKNVEDMYKHHKKVHEIKYVNTMIVKDRERWIGTWLKSISKASVIPPRKGILRKIENKPNPVGKVAKKKVAPVAVVTATTAPEKKKVTFNFEKNIVYPIENKESAPKLPTYSRLETQSVEEIHELKTINDRLFRGKNEKVNLTLNTLFLKEGVHTPQ